MKTVGDDGIVVLVPSKRTRAYNSTIRRGPLKGKQVELASTTGVMALETIVEDFMLEIFGFEAGEYLITDLSSLYDFVGVDDLEAHDINAKVRAAYGLDLADLRGGNLLGIFNQLCDQRHRDELV